MSSNLILSERASRSKPGAEQREISLLPSDRDHFAAADSQLETAADGLEFFDDKAAAANQYALLAIGHALVRIADALDRTADHWDEFNGRGARSEENR